MPTMTVRRQMIRGGATVALGQLAGKVLSLVRNVIVARLITPADFGIGATFVIIVSLLEMLSDLGIGTLVVQSEEGNSPNFLHTAHLVNAARGVLNGLILFALAGPCSLLFNVPQAAWAFRWLALYPLMRSFSHLDVYRFQREMRFAPNALVDAVSQLITTGLAWPLTAWLQDYSALLWLVLAQRVIATVGSFVVAKWPYRWRWDRRLWGTIYSFGWPMMIAGLLLFCILQGDRIVIASASRFFPRAHYTMTDLGLYSAAFTLSVAVGSGLNGIVTSPLLPLLAQVQSQIDRFSRRYALSVQVLALLGGAVGITFIVAGKFAIALLYGTKYAGAEALIGWFGATQALRLIRAGPNIAAIALGDTRIDLIGSSVRAASLGGVLIVASFGGGLVWMCVCGAMAEFLALVVSAERLQARHRIPSRIILWPLVIVILSMFVVAVVANHMPESRGWATTLIACSAGSSGLALVSAVIFPELRRELQGLRLSR